MKKNIKMLFLASLVFTACSKNEDSASTNPLDQPLTAGSANFSKFVSLGNSLTSGYSDSALFKQGQQNCFPKILADQFALVGGGAFTIPYMNDNVGGLTFSGTVIQGPRLYFNPSIGGPAPVSGTPSTEVLTTLTGPFNNMGVPGAKSFHMLAAGYGNAAGVPSGAANPYFVRFRSTASASMLGDAVAQNPTFFSLWAGNNDVLSYATTGGVGINQTGNSASPATYGSNDITDPITFAGIYNTLVNGLTAGGAKGVVANIPYVNTIPFFTTVPFNPLKPSVLGGGSVPTGDATINALNTQLYGPLKAALSAIPGGAGRINLLIASSASNPDPVNPLLIKDEYLTNLSTQLTTVLLGAPFNFPPATAGAFGAIYGQARQATPMDYVLLTSRAEIGAIQPSVPASINKKGITYPFEDKLVLSAGEVSELKIATDAFNATIKSVSMGKGLAFVDANAILSQVATAGGSSFGSNYVLTSQYVVGGAFSMDGVHPSPRGYALIANKFFEAINLAYGSNFRPVDIGKFQIQYPAVLPN